eukprot:1159524-Prymnesium_polylepis.1
MPGVGPVLASVGPHWRALLQLIVRARGADGVKASPRLCVHGIQDRHTGEGLTRDDFERASDVRGLNQRIKE